MLRLALSEKLHSSSLIGLFVFSCYVIGLHSQEIIVGCLLLGVFAEAQRKMYVKARCRDINEERLSVSINEICTECSSPKGQGTGFLHHDPDWADVLFGSNHSVVTACPLIAAVWNVRQRELKTFRPRPCSSSCAQCFTVVINGSHITLHE